KHSRLRERAGSPRVPRAAHAGALVVLEPIDGDSSCSGACSAWRSRTWRYCTTPPSYCTAASAMRSSRCRHCDCSQVLRSNTEATGGGSCFLATSLSISVSPRPARPLVRSRSAGRGRRVARGARQEVGEPGSHWFANGSGRKCVPGEGRGPVVERTADRAAAPLSQLAEG